MRHNLLIIFVFILISVPLASLTAVANHDDSHGHHGCLAAIAQGIDCPNTMSPLSFILFHVNTFKTFSSAVFNENTAFLFFLLASLILFIGARADLNTIVFKSLHRNDTPLPNQTISKPNIGLIYWLSIHINSPNPFKAPIH